MSDTKQADAKTAGGKPGGGPRHDPKVMMALRNFAMSITVFNIAGYIFLGFEQPWLWPLAALATGYTVELVLEKIGAKVEGRAPRYQGGGAKGLMQFLFPAHITSLAVNMLIYVNDQFWVLIFGVAVAVGTKWVLRVPIKGRVRHYMNPSNFGIVVILLLFPWGSIAPPYHFTENLYGWADWIIPGLVIIGGTMINGKLTGRMWLIAGWVGGFALQAILRGVFFDTSIAAALGMMTGVAFILFTNYMISDPGTTPSKPAAQLAFGGGVAAVYGILMVAHIAYTIFLATALVCLMRGMYHWTIHLAQKSAKLAPAVPIAPAAQAVPSPAVEGKAA
ncbi:enediyne biosynthesis protein [Actinokineospora sp. 24-640]